MLRVGKVREQRDWKQLPQTAERLAAQSEPIDPMSGGCHNRQDTWEVNEEEA